MNKETIKQKIREIAAKEYHPDALTLPDDTKMSDVFDPNSIQDVAFIVALDEKFDIYVPNDIAQTIDTLQQATDCVHNLLQEKENENTESP